MDNLKLIQHQFKKARLRSVPLLGIISPDPAQTVSWIQLSEDNDVPLVQWDSSRGLMGLNRAGAESLMLISQLDSLADLKNLTMDAVNALDLVSRMPEHSVVIFLQLTSHWGHPEVVQATWNLRDAFKSDFRTLVILAPNIILPPILQHDLILLEESLPDDQEIIKIARELYKAGGLDLPDELTEQRICETVRGLPAFSVEQIIAMSFNGHGLKFDVLWEHKQRQIESTPGLQVCRVAEPLSAMGGVTQAKAFMDNMMRGPEQVTAFVYIEEIEKAFAGSSSDHTGDGGVSKDALQVVLTNMEENEWIGLIAVGPPGSGKSTFSRSVGATYDRPTIAFDLGATRTSLVGASEQAIRACFRVIKAIAGKHAYFIATCNKYQTLPPELKRRFADGIWYFGMPNDDELDQIWAIQRSRYQIAKDDIIPHGVRYTGADVRNICRTAYRLSISLEEASQYIVPISISDPGVINALEEAANGRFLDASRPGTYRKPGADKFNQSTIKGRAMNRMEVSA